MFSPSLKQLYTNEPPKDQVLKPFGADAQTFTIGQRLPQRVVQTPGPGEYSVERADSVTKCANPQYRLDSGKKRPDNFATQADYIAEPGTYETVPKFGSGAKTYSISTSPTRNLKS